MIDPYIIIAGISILVIVSYFYSLIADKFRIPSVLLLILTGIGIKYALSYYELSFPGTSVLREYLGIIGLIMIVLEGALDLHLEKEKLGLIARAFFSALFILVLSSLTVAYFIQVYLGNNFFNSLIYAIPICVVSSAIVISSVNSLSADKKEFMIYESTFSDILGIMFFNFTVLSSGTGTEITASIISNILITIVLSGVLSYILVLSFNKIKTHIKLFLMIAILTLLYSIGKFLHFSSLLIILVFGLIINNTDVFFKGFLKKFINREMVKPVLNDFKVVTAETTFLIRTFFFVIFGMTIDLHVLIQFDVLVAGTGILLILYVIRFIYLKTITKTTIFPEIFLAPRGLITILLFYSIPVAYRLGDFNEGIMFYLILSSNLIMMVALMGNKNKDKAVNIQHRPIPREYYNTILSVYSQDELEESTGKIEDDYSDPKKAEEEKKKASEEDNEQ